MSPRDTRGRGAREEPESVLLPGPQQSCCKQARGLWSTWPRSGLPHHSVGQILEVYHSNPSCRLLH